MSLAELQAFDADILAHLPGEIEVVPATLHSADGTHHWPCRILVDRGTTLNGFQGQVITNQITITAFLSEIAQPPDIGARFDVGTEVFTVDSMAAADDNVIVCVVKVGV